MKKIYKFLIIFLINFNTSTAKKVPNADWTIVGAGPAGIATVGLLIDAGVPAKKIAWIDPEFKVGRLGKYYKTVPSNTQTKWFIEFIEGCKAFSECESKSIEKLYRYHPEKEYPLSIIVEPLQDITAMLQSKVMSIKSKMISLDFREKYWFVGTKKGEIQSSNVILATGCHPKKLDYPCDCHISLDIALSKQRLAKEVNSDDSVAVIGSAHSAILILKYLTELSVARIVNFYTRPLTYPVDMGDWVKNESIGLRGEAARWAQSVLEKNLPENLIRIKNSPETLKTWLPLCTKIIYACGYERNELPPINGDTNVYNNYDRSSGIIAPRLFGIGIAFPEEYSDPYGNTEHGIGLPDFLEYIQANLPIWMKKKCPHLNLTPNLFSIIHL